MKNSARRTKVIDDESDYYQSNSTWFSAEEREKLRKQESEARARKHASRLDKRVTIDFMGRVVEDDQFNDLQAEELAETISYNDFENPNICPTIEFDRPTVRIFKNYSNLYTRSSFLTNLEFSTFLVILCQVC